MLIAQLWMTAGNATAVRNWLGQGERFQTARGGIVAVHPAHHVYLWPTGSPTW
jgi:hypothetical protein